MNGLLRQIYQTNHLEVVFLNLISEDWICTKKSFLLSVNNTICGIYSREMVFFTFNSVFKSYKIMSKESRLDIITVFLYGYLCIRIFNIGKPPGWGLYPMSILVLFENYLSKYSCSWNIKNNLGLYHQPFKLLITKNSQTQSFPDLLTWLKK